MGTGLARQGSVQRKTSVKALVLVCGPRSYPQTCQDTTRNPQPERQESRVILRAAGGGQRAAVFISL